MTRALHRWPGLLAAALLITLALSGAVLSVFPAAERLAAPTAVAGQNVAELAQNIQTQIPAVEQIRRSPNGKITAYWFDQNNNPASATIDPATGKAVSGADPNRFHRWLIDLHRSLFLGDNGRWVMALGAASMLVLAVSGALLVARRTGGWRRWFSSLKGPLSSRIHVEIARIAVLGLALSSVTALWMTASTFGFLPDVPNQPAFPDQVSGKSGVSFAGMPVLGQTPVSALRELTFPYPNDTTDVFTLKTDTGTGYIDQGTGALLSWADLGPWQKVSETIYMLHTGQGAATLGLVLGLMALGVPLMAVTGFVIWLSQRRRRPRLRHNLAAGRAETIVLVGSESGATWGFAATLHAALTEAGQHVHTGAMASFDPARTPHAKRFLVLAATYGDGDAPSSAKGFLDRINRLASAPEAPIAVLGFGDRSFPDYCGFAHQVQAAAEAKGWAQLVHFETVDRQSPQDFARWGHALGEALGVPLSLSHHPVRPDATALTLVSRRDFGAEVQSPTAILRFALPQVPLARRLTGRGFGRFAAGDLLAVLPDGSDMPRYYSLASGQRDGFIEIVVKKHPGGLCSGQLTGLEPGDTVRAFLRPNPGFRPGRSKAPLILVGAGTGIGPLAGFVRGNGSQRPVHLYFGMRDPASDFLYCEDLASWLEDGSLTRVVPAVSRARNPSYVQDALRHDAAEVANLVRAGARVMVCGGREMAAGVSAALTDILSPHGLTPASLKAEGRYVEDVY